MIDHLPQPSPNALVHSEQLQQLICERIVNSSKSCISFHDFMQMALYEPQLGYYIAGSHKIGQQGDFTTAPEISALYSKCIASQCVQILHSLPESSLLELGGGTGKMAKDCLLYLDSINCLPKQYYLLEISPDLKERQQQYLQQHIPHLMQHITWLDELPTTFNGIIIANEVLDAMPVEVFAYNAQEAQFKQQVVTLDKSQQLTLNLRNAPYDLSSKITELPIPQTTNYTSELNPHIQPWLNALGNCLEQGVVLLIDYGYTQTEYYHPERKEGTLICHYQHHVHSNPLAYIGLQDITANVDFTAVAHAANHAGFELAGYTQQNHFLINNQLEKHFQQALDDSPEQQYQLAQQVRTLTLPQEMGERFKVMALSKGFTEMLDGFRLGDLSHRL